MHNAIIGVLENIVVVLVVTAESNLRSEHQPVRKEDLSGGFNPYLLTTAATSAGLELGEHKAVLFCTAYETLA